MTILQKALEELSDLPEEKQSMLVARFQDMIARAKIDAKLEASERRGGATTSDEFFAELRAEYGG